ncbi:MAG TPA: carbohydrate ABC transporter permease [Chloroflexota bacterium]|jgi:ABC-type glycerol-3-phosphate transport system permease component|nr:carbohydrate ABC transporter permease [Chloroflexota bacterium]
MIRHRSLPRRIVLYSGLFFFGVWTILPMYWIIVTAIKPNLLIYREPSIIPTQITGDHFAFVLTRTPFLQYVKNSLLVTLVTTSLAMIIGTLAAYAIVRLTFRGREFFARGAVVTYLVPGSLLFIPMFQVIYSIGLIDNIVGLMVTYLTFTVPFATWMMIGYFRNVPSELEDAALVDGCSRVQALARIMVPIALPALAVVALVAFTLSWNEFLYALVFIGSDSQKTLTLGLIGLVRGDTFPWGPMMAAALLGALPPTLVYIFSQRWVVSGLAAGGVKG